MRAKQLRKALEDLSDEGVSQLFIPLVGSSWVVGVVGQLQLEVLMTRIESEYNVKAGFDSLPYETARWVTGSDPVKLKLFIDRNKTQMAEDRDGRPVYLVRNDWDLRHVQDNNETVSFLKTREQFF